MIERASDRDDWKLAHWDEYIAKCNFNRPTDIGEIFIFNNNSMEEFKESIERIKKLLD